MNSRLQDLGFGAFGDGDEVDMFTAALQQLQDTNKKVPSCLPFFHYPLEPSSIYLY